MKTVLRKSSSRELAGLRSRLANAEQALLAIRNGEVDAVVVAGKKGPQVFTLQGAEHVYRMLIESMNEGALTLTADKTILYANQCFARMVKCPLEQVTGSSFRRFLSAENRTALRALMKAGGTSRAKIQVLLKAGDGSLSQAQISIRPLARDMFNAATVGMVVTDMTELRRQEEMLRSLTHRVVQVQEAERGRVALELHDNITQLLCGVLVRCETMANHLSAGEGGARAEALKLGAMLGETAREVERISQNLRPGVLEHLGLQGVLSDTGTDFIRRTGVALKLACVKLPDRLPADTELALYRILQEALKNVQKHARAKHATVSLSRPDGFIQLLIKDDGIGFEPDRRRVRGKAKGALGLLSMRERATYVGGTLEIKSSRGHGTSVTARIPVVDGDEIPG